MNLHHTLNRARLIRLLIPVCLLAAAMFASNIFLVAGAAVGGSQSLSTAEISALRLTKPDESLAQEPEATVGEIAAMLSAELLLNPPLFFTDLPVAVR